MLNLEDPEWPQSHGWKLVPALARKLAGAVSLGTLGASLQASYYVLS